MMFGNCIICNDEFFIRNKTQRMCSTKCAGINRIIKKPKRYCIECNGVITGRKNMKFCSHSCYGINKKTRKNTHCLICGKITKSYNAKLCSVECGGQWTKKIRFKPFHYKKTLEHDCLTLNLTTKEIAKKYSVNTTRITYYFRKFNITMPKHPLKIYHNKHYNIKRKTRCRGKIPPYRIKYVLEKYIKQGLTKHEIADKCSTTPNRIYNFIDKFNLNDLFDSIHKPYYNKPLLIQEYIIKKRTTVDIGKEYGVEPSTISRCLKKFKINLRNFKDYSKLRETIKKRPKIHWKQSRQYEYLIQDWKFKSAKIRERDKYKCQICFGRAQLHVHHILPLKKYPSFKYNDNNLTTLCKKCHLKIHSKIRQYVI